MYRSDNVVDIKRWGWLCFAAFLYGTSAIADTTLPIITHDVITNEVAAGSTVIIDAQVTDDGPIAEVRLNFKLPDQTGFTTREMLPGASNSFQAVLKSDEVLQPAVDYFITAQDAAGNQQSRGFAFDPLRLRVGPPAVFASGTEANTGTELEVGETNRIWYVVGAIAVAGLVAILTDDEEPKPNGCPCVGVEL